MAPDVLTDDSDAIVHRVNNWDVLCDERDALRAKLLAILDSLSIQGISSQRFGRTKLTRAVEDAYAFMKGKP